MLISYVSEKFINNPRTIEKLSESYPIRRSAQLSYYLYLRGQRLKSETMKEVKQSLEQAAMEMKKKR